MRHMIYELIYSLKLSSQKAVYRNEEIGTRKSKITKNVEKLIWSAELKRL